MGPVPKESQNNPADNDRPPGHSDSEDLEAPNHIIPPAVNSSDDDDEMDSDTEGPAGDGYMLLPQDPEEEGDGDGEGTFHSQAFPPLSALDVELMSTESMTEVRGAGVDVSEAVAEGSVHPGFAASFPDNKVPVHLQVPTLPKRKKEDILWNNAAASDRLQLDSAHLSKVKSAMANFQLPSANIPDWARQVPDDDWKHMVERLTSPASPPVSGPLQSKPDSCTLDSGDAGGGGSTETAEQDSQWPGTSGT